MHNERAHNQARRDRRNWRELLAGGLHRTGALRVLQGLSRSYELHFAPQRSLPQWHRTTRAKFAVLCYHHVGSEGIPFYSTVAVEVFEAQMRFLRKRYRVVSLEQLCRELEDPQSAGQAVAVTFDDGYRDVYTQAFPILERYAIPATVFVTVAAVESGEVSWYDRVFLALQVFPGEKLEIELDEPRRFELTSPEVRLRAATEIVSRLRKLTDARRQECCAVLEKRVALPADALADRMLTWEQIRRMQRAGISFGSHTMTHPVVSRLEPTEVERELRESKRILEERLDRPVTDFAYPFGQPADCGTDSTPLLARCGYRSAATTTKGINAPGADLYRLRRVQFADERSLAMFAFKLNRLFFCVEEGIFGKDATTASSAHNAAVSCSERSSS